MIMKIIIMIVKIIFCTFYDQFFIVKPDQEVLSHWLVFKRNIWINKDKAELTKSKKK